MKIKVVTVIGANGNMGMNVSGIIAGFGKCKVYLLARNLENAVAAVDSICQTIKSDSIRGNLIPKDYSELAFCVEKSDWVFESVAEEVTLKKKITQEIFKYANKKTIVTTGTSGLSISQIAEEIPAEFRANYFGTHFFNPPYNLNLCEIIATKFSDDKIFGEFSDYLEKILLRTVVKVKDRPAFLANRVGFQLINQALQLAEEFQEFGGIDYIDHLFQGVTGRSMAPLMTADYVGLDVHAAIVENLKLNTKDYSNQSFNKPNFLQGILDAGYLGRKTSCGLYKRSFKNGEKRNEVYDIQTNQYREVRAYSIPILIKMKKEIQTGNYKKAYDYLIADSSQEGKILKNLLLDNAIYSYFVNSQVSADLYAIDKAMANGFNWCPPNSWIDLFQGKEVLKKIYQQESRNQIEEKELDILLATVVSSKIDYRRYIKA